MFRKLAIALFALAAAATLVLAGVSEWRAIHLDASREPELFIEGLPLQLFVERFLCDRSAPQRWTHAVVVDSRITVSYCSRYEPPRSLLTASGNEVLDFGDRWHDNRYGVWMVWPSRTPARENELLRSVQFDDEYHELVQAVRRATSLRLNTLLGDASFLLRYTDTPHRQAVVRFPLWVPLILFSIWPAAAFIRGPVRRYRRRKRGLCLQCGYNLTGVPEPRCPECGEAT